MKNYDWSIQGTLEHLERVIGDERVKIVPRDGSKEPDPVRVLIYKISYSFQPFAFRNTNVIIHPWSVTNPDSPIGKQIQRAIRRTMSKTVPLPAIFIAMADSRWLTDFSDSIFRLNPLKMDKSDIGGIHGPNEKIQLYSYQETINFIFDFCKHIDDPTVFDHTEL